MKESFVSLSKRYYFVILAAVVGFFLVIAGTSKYGPGISHDSISYIFAGESLLEGRGFLNYGHETVFNEWPPLFPAIMALFKATGLDVVQSVRFFNAAVFALVILLSGYWLLKNLRSYLFAVLGILAVALSVPLLEVSVFAWTEPLFIMFIVLFLIIFEEYMVNQELTVLVVSALTAALACLTRYIGVTVIAMGALFLLLQHKSFTKRLRDLLLFGFISASPLGIWILRNYIRTSTLMGKRVPSPYTLRKNLSYAFRTAAMWFYDYNRVDAALHINSLLILKIIVAILVIAGVARLIIYAMERIRTKSIMFRREYGAGEGEFSMALVVAFTLVYIGYLVATASMVAFNRIDTRLMSPAFVPLVLSIFITVDRVVGYFSERRGNFALKYTLGLLAAVCLIYPSKTSLANIRYNAENGAGIFATSEWQESEVIKYLRGNAKNGRVYSNNPDAIYVLTDIYARFNPPREEFDKLKKSLKDEECMYFVLFNSGWGNLAGIEDLKSRFDVELVLESEHGSIYRVK